MRQRVEGNESRRVKRRSCCVCERLSECASKQRERRREPQSPLRRRKQHLSLPPSFAFALAIWFLRRGTLVDALTRNKCIPLPRQATCEGTGSARHACCGLREKALLVPPIATSRLSSRANGSLFQVSRSHLFLAGTSREIHRLMLVGILFR